MATNLTGTTIASTYEKLLKRADTYVAAGVNIEVQNDSAVAAASSLYLDITNGNVGIGDTLPAEAKLSIDSVAAGDIGLKVVQAQAQYGISLDHNANEKAIYIDHDGVTSEATMYFASPTTTTGTVIRVDDCNALTTGRMMELKSASTDVGVRSLVQITNDEAAAVGATCLSIQQDSTGKAISATGGIVEEGGVLKENLLTNSGFDVWSNSTLENVGSDLITNGNMSSATGWSVGTNWSIGSGVATATNSESYLSRAIVTTAGKLYKLSAAVTTTAAGYVVIAVGASAGDEGPEGRTLVTNGVDSDGTFTLVFEAQSDTDTVFFTGALFDGTIDNVTLYEVTPGCVAADVKAPDGWEKAAAMDIWRQHTDDTLTKDGSQYSLKCSTGTGRLLTPVNRTNKSDFYARMAGRTVTLGCWVYSVGVSNNVNLAMYHGGGWNSSGVYGQSNTWTWLEYTQTINAASTDVAFAIEYDTTDVSYVSQPMLVFGSSIGEGNYTRPQGEVVWLEKSIDSDKFDSASFSDVSSTLLNLEADTNGKLPKGAKAVAVSTTIRDSGSAGTDCAILLSGVTPANNHLGHLISAHGLANDSYARTSGWTGCNADGDYYYYIDATGSSTLDMYFRYNAVQLR